jgi:hypothetical protein
MDVAKHSVKVQPAFNHLKIIQLLNFMNTVTNNKWEFGDQLNNCKLIKEDLVPS